MPPGIETTNSHEALFKLRFPIKVNDWKPLHLEVVYYAAIVTNTVPRTKTT